MSDDEIRQLIADGYKSVSRKYGTIARLPISLSGREALATHDRRMAERETKGFPPRYVHSESDCEGFYMRVFAQADGLWMNLSQPDFVKFRKMGGRSAR